MSRIKKIMELVKKQNYVTQVNDNLEMSHNTEIADFQIEPVSNFTFFGSNNDDTVPITIPEINKFTVVDNVDIEMMGISECGTNNDADCIISISSDHDGDAYQLLPFDINKSTVICGTLLPCTNVSSVTQESPSTNESNKESVASTSYSTNNAVEQVPSRSAMAQNNFQKWNLINDCDIISDESENDRPLVPYSEHSDSIDSVDSDLPSKSKKRKKRFQVKKDTWFGGKNKLRREKGKGYFGRTKSDGKWMYDIERTAREMKKRCTCKGGDKSLLKCTVVSEEHRKTIFQNFWNLTWGEKKIYIDNAIRNSSVQRPRDRKDPEHSRRAQTLFYYLKVNEQAIRVCRTMFLNTLSIGRWTALNWKNILVSEPERQPSSYRGHQKTKANPFEADNLSLLAYIDALPAMESHYCRSTTSKKYLLPEWKSKQALYKFYVEDWCKTQDVVPLSISSFNNALNLRNIALFRPKKDECEKCAGNKVGQISTIEYQLHISKKNEARLEKENDTLNEPHIFTMDLQAVLMSPKSNVSSLYYRTKLCVHNLCFFNLRTKDGYSYIWNESEGGLNAENFATCFSYFIETQVLPTINRNSEPPKIIVYSDGCTYQNRNNVIANAAVNLAMLHNVTIVQKYLEVGHTQMEVDAMHSTIERCVKNRTINVPADYAYICKIARRKPGPYVVKYLDHTFFKSFQKVTFVSSIRPGRKKGDAKVTDIRALKFTPTGEIFYKFRFGDQWETLPQRRKGATQPCPFDQLDNLYSERLKIKTRKFNDLQELKKVLDVDFHEYYDNIPHE